MILMLCCLEVADLYPVLGKCNIKAWAFQFLLFSVVVFTEGGVNYVASEAPKVIIEYFWEN